MRATVWMNEGQPGDHKTSYFAGDPVTLRISDATDADWTVWGEVFGAATARTITHVFDSYSRPAEVWTGRIIGIRAVRVTYSDGERSGHALPGSGREKSVYEASRRLPEPDADGTTWGYLIDLNLAERLEDPDA